MSATALAEPRRTRPEPGRVDPRPDQYVSEHEYWLNYYLGGEVHYEWNNGHLEEKPVSDNGTFLVYEWFMHLLRLFLDAQPIAKLAGLEMGFRLALPTGTVIRRPDFAVVRHDNPQPLLPFDVSYHGVFDLCIEALSDLEHADILRDTVVKKAEYAAAGVPEYYILHRTYEQQAFFTRDPTGVYTAIAPADGVIRSRVLPGFQFRLADLCRRPEHATLRDDPVYADFVLPGWRAAEARAATAEQAQRKAEQAQREAEAHAVAEEQGRWEAEERAAVEAEGRRAAEERAVVEAQARRAAEQRAQDAEQALARLQAPGSDHAGQP